VEEARHGDITVPEAIDSIVLKSALSREEIALVFISGPI